ncbi:MAG: MgtC/SapB family protein, partial [Candidatus Eremiobacteraeota bacterium]|nr:MgtC/SapB family protein [Candidatus Eremiobacteraeota bacterium]
MDHLISAADFGLRLFLGGLLGVAIGFERQWRQRSAGLQTSALVSVGACLFALAASLMAAANEARIVANIVSGVGFIAGGVILRQGLTVTGLNTAATIWSTAAVGALAGAGLYMYALEGAAAIIFFNVVLTPFAALIDSRSLLYREKHGETTYVLHVLCEQEHDDAVRSAIIDAVNASRLNLRSLSTEQKDEGEEVRAELWILQRDDSLI